MVGELTQISRLHFITHEVAGLSHIDLVELVCKSGADWIQLRVKDKSYEEYRSLAMEALGICRKHEVKLIINDNVALAREVKADGVHIGKNDMDPLDARTILGNEFIIGGTANTFEDVLKLSKAGVDYIGLGPFRFTTTKKNLSPILGIEGYEEILEKMKEAGIAIPVVAIGGIHEDDLRSLFKTGIHGVAISSAISLATDKLSATRGFIDTIKELKHA